MAASAKRTTRNLALWALALCLLIPLGACAYQEGSDALQSLASTASDENAEKASSEADADGGSTTPDETDKASSESNNPTDDATDTAAGDTSATNDTTGSASGSASNDASEAAPGSAEGNPAAKPEENESSRAGTATDAAETEGALTTATIMYYENVNYEDGDTKPDAEGHVLLGTYELTDVHVGQTLNAWDYVVNIPGFFFWDGWPQNLTLTENASDNVIKLFYFKLWNNEYTVNYYLMENADLTADNWKDALAPDDVKFVKMGSETFTDQRFDKLVKGDAYEYKIDGTYVVDTYPSEIRVGVNPDDNVINVLYVPDSANLPDDIEVPTDTTPPSDATQPDDTTPPDDSENGADAGDQPADGSGADKPADDSSADKPADTPSADGSATPSLPNDTTFDKDEIESVLPDDVKDEVVKDFIESGDAQDKTEITEEMIENPVSKSDADYVKNVYETGLKEGEKLAQTGDLVPLAIIASIALGAAAAGAIAFIMNRRAKR